MFKELLFILACSVTGTVMASEVRQISITEGPIHVLGGRSHKVTSRLADLQKMFLNTPLTERVRINSAFGYRLHPVSGKWAGNQGIDYAAPKGKPIRATAPGTITFIDRRRVVEGKSGSVRVDLGGSRSNKKNKKTNVNKR